MGNMQRYKRIERELNGMAKSKVFPRVWAQFGDSLVEMNAALAKIDWSALRATTREAGDAFRTIGRL